MEGNNFATLPPKAPSHGGTGDEDSFGTRKARSSFGRGFFKIKNNKRTASAPNLGRYHAPACTFCVFWTILITTVTVRSSLWLGGTFLSRRFGKYQTATKKPLSDVIKYLICFGLAVISLLGPCSGLMLFWNASCLAVVHTWDLWSFSSPGYILSLSFITFSDVQKWGSSLSFPLYVCLSSLAKAIATTGTGLTSYSSSPGMEGRLFDVVIWWYLHLTKK